VCPEEGKRKGRKEEERGSQGRRGGEAAVPPIASLLIELDLLTM